MAADLVIGQIKTDDGFLSWREANGEQYAVDLQAVEVVMLPVNGERPVLKCGSGTYYPPLGYADAMNLWSTARRNAPRKIGF